MDVNLKLICEKAVKNILCSVLNERKCFNFNSMYHIERIDDIIEKYNSNEIESVSEFCNIFLSDLNKFNNELLHYRYEKEIKSIFNTLDVFMNGTKKEVISELKLHNIDIKIKAGITDILFLSSNGDSIISDSFRLAYDGVEHQSMRLLYKLKEQIILENKLRNNKFRSMFEISNNNRQDTVEDFYNTVINIDKDDLPILLTSIFCEIMNIKYKPNDYTSAHKYKYDVNFLKDNK